MRSVIQRVLSAKVDFPGNQEARQIGKGLLALVAFRETDNESLLKWMAKKMIDQRIFADAQGKMNLSLKDVQGELLIVSQFTLYADSSKGNRPSFTGSAPPDIALPLYDLFLKITDKEYPGKTKSGEFGKEMQVTLINDGPVTLQLDTDKNSL